MSSKNKFVFALFSVYLIGVFLNLPISALEVDGDQYQQQQQQHLQPKQPNIRSSRSIKKMAFVGISYALHSAGKHISNLHSSFMGNNTHTTTTTTTQKPTTTTPAAMKRRMPNLDIIKNRIKRSATSLTMPTSSPKPDFTNFVADRTKRHSIGFYLAAMSAKSVLRMMHYLTPESPIYLVSMARKSTPISNNKREKRSAIEKKTK